MTRRLAGYVALAVWAAFLIYRWATPRGPGWDQPRRVAIVVANVDANPTEFERGRLNALLARLPALESQLNFEYSRYREGKGPGFRFTIFGPIVGGDRPPPYPAVTFAAARKYRQQSQAYVAKLAERCGLNMSEFDSTVAIVAMYGVGQEPYDKVDFNPPPTFAIARTPVDDETVDRSLFVAAKQLMYTLGASDKLDVHRKPRIPYGLGDPEQNPLYPQVYANVMAGQIVVYPEALQLPSTLRELSVAPETAREIGWLQATLSPPEHCGSDRVGWIATWCK